MIFLLQVYELIDIKEKKAFSSNFEKNLFIITNEIQLINALEARHHFKSTNTIFVFLQFGHDKDIYALDKYKEELDCHQLISVNYDEAPVHLFEHINLIRYLAQYNYENVFLGYFSTRMRRYVCNLNYQNIFLLDDGTYTIVLHDELYNKHIKDMPSMLETSQLRNSQSLLIRSKHYLYNASVNIIFNLFGLNNDLKNYQVAFFSSFNLIQNQTETIVKNNYTVLHSQYQTNQKSMHDDKIVYFLGQALHKTLHLSSVEYKHHLEKVIKFYQEINLKVKYIPHRSRSQEYATVESSLESNDFSIIHIDKSFELYLLDKDATPARIASFYSSALFNVKNILPSMHIDAFTIDFDKTKRSDIDIIYESLKRENITVHEFPQSTKSTKKML